MAHTEYIFIVHLWEEFIVRGCSVSSFAIRRLTRLVTALAVIGVGFTFVQAEVSAQPLVRLPLDGKAVEFKDPSFPDSLQSVRFYAQSNADFTQPLAISIRAPAGAIVSVQAARTKARTPAGVKRSAFYPVPMRKSGATAIAQSIRLRSASSMTSQYSSGSPVETTAVSSGGCCGLSTSFLNSFLSAYPSCSDYQCICEILASTGVCSAFPGAGGGTGTPGSGGGSSGLPGFTTPTGGADDQFYASALIEGAFMKDACARNATPSLLEVTVDLSRVNRSRLTNGLAINIAALERTYTGSRAASIKPVSDGKYAPRPLLIMARAAPGREAVRVVRWKQGKPRIERIYDRLDSAFYRGFSLLRVPVELPGGFASVDVVDDDNYTKAYGVCLEMVRRRQRVNGYPTSPRDG